MVTTSWAPDVAFSAPGMKPAKAPKSVATTSASTQSLRATLAPRSWANFCCRMPLISTVSTIVAGPGKLLPKSVTTVIAPMVPIRNWPRPPMLKSPALKPRPTPSPARISGVEYTSVDVMPFSEPTAPDQRAP